MIAMTNPPFTTLPDDARRTRATFALPLLLGLVCYQFVLCFLNTNFFPVSNAIVAAVEAILLAAVAARVAFTCSINEMIGVMLLLLYFALIWAFRGAIDAADARNIMIILLAYAWGRATADRAIADKIVWAVSGVVLFWAAIEYFFTDTYLHYFNILHYYIARGEVSAVVPAWVKQNTFISGQRTGGRNLFPFLGDLRVSSVFLEPVSMGNYAIILASWALSFDAKEKKAAIGHFIVALVLIVACDSRFASILVLFLALLRCVPVARKKAVLLALPLMTAAGLIAIAATGLGDAAQDNLPGRLARTGAALQEMSVAQMIGFGIPGQLPDMGIAYAIEHFGIFLCLILWLLLVMPKLVNRQARRYRMMLSVYCLGILAVSGTSFFSAKTAALAWFLYGVLRADTVDKAKPVACEKPVLAFSGENIS